MKTFTVSAAPFYRNRQNTTRKIMLDVLTALVPCFLAASLFFGYHVLINLVASMGACFGAELLMELAQKGFKKENVKNASCRDCSCLVTGALFALTMPSKIMVRGWDLNFYANGFRTGGGANAILFSFDTLIVCIIGSIFAIAVVKMLFGGIGKNFMNPAGAAHIFLLLCFSYTAVTAGAWGLSGTAGATWLSGDKATGNASLFLDMFLGNKGSASVGETSMIAILMGCAYLCFKRVIDVRIPLIGLGCFCLFIFIFDGMIARDLLGRVDTPARLFNNLFANLMTGGFIFGLVFMATDYSTTPNTFTGHLIFIAGYALLTALIRAFAAWPEGAFFAILLMNVATPLIDRYVIPKPFGYQKERKSGVRGAAKLGIRKEELGMKDKKSVSDTKQSTPSEIPHSSLLIPHSKDTGVAP
ncbi:MAG: RnfABCDGE type electron transport complex subunit D [Firmicutes bacterium]|nr:RnfABCDGE type electron transport complex subunit D [Bacillota bacterium]